MDHAATQSPPAAGHPPAGLASAADPVKNTTATTAPAPHSGPVDTALLGRTSIGLLAVIGVILIAAWLLKRFGTGRGGDSQRLRLIASRSVGNRERIVIMEIEDQWLVLGITPHSINCLHQLSARPPDNPSAPRVRPSFREALAENWRQMGLRGQWPRGPRR
jgi:flagellar protein FliO/FliZ